MRALAGMAVLLLAAPAAQAAKVTVPVDVGVGPAAYYFFGPVTDNRWPAPHFGLKINVLAVIDKETVQANRDRIPPRYRKMAEGITEVRISPSIFIPEELIISPKVDSLGGTGIYGVTWRPLSVGVPIVRTQSSGWHTYSSTLVDLQAGLLLTAAYLYSDFLPTTVFLRPGVDFKLEAEAMASRSFGISVGAALQLYVPQKLGSFGMGPLEESIFHVATGFVKLHFRFPYEANI